MKDISTKLLTDSSGPPHNLYLFNILTGNLPDYSVPWVVETPDSPRKLAMVLAYDGSNFNGWQTQPVGNTLQQTLSKVLSGLCNHEVRLQVSGRTDKGVHALGQVAAFNTDSSLSLTKMLKALNSILPSEILIRALGAVNLNFHPRFSAKAKTYDYFLLPENNSIFLQNRAWVLPERLNAQAIKQALFFLPGKHNIRSLASQTPDKTESTKRHIMEAQLEVDKTGIWRIRITAEGFLRHVIRNLVGILVYIGLERVNPGELRAMLKTDRRTIAAPKAPAGGLYLSRVFYQPWTGPVVTG